MNTISWKVQKVISLETRKGTFALAQLGPSPYLVIFNLFSPDDTWAGINLTRESILFCHAVTRQLLKMSTIREVKEVPPLTEINYPTHWISEDPSSRKVTIWQGTPNEMTLFSLGEKGASLIKNDITVAGFKETPVIIPTISPSDQVTVAKHELISIAIYPEFNERLFLCSQANANVDPAKDLVFNKELSVTYKQYFQIVSGQVPIKNLGY